MEDLEDGGAEALGFFGADAFDGAELGDGAGVLEDERAQGGGAEDEELREVEAFGFGGSPGAKAVIEGLLVGGEFEGCGGWGPDR